MIKSNQIKSIIKILLLSSFFCTLQASDFFEDRKNSAVDSAKAKLAADPYDPSSIFDELLNDLEHSQDPTELREIADFVHKICQSRDAQVGEILISILPNISENALMQIIDIIEDYSGRLHSAIPILEKRLPSLSNREMIHLSNRIIRYNPGKAVAIGDLIERRIPSVADTDLEQLYSLALNAERYNPTRRYDMALVLIRHLPEATRPTDGSNRETFSNRIEAWYTSFSLADKQKFAASDEASDFLTWANGSTDPHVQALAKTLLPLSFAPEAERALKNASL